MRKTSVADPSAATRPELDSTKNPAKRNSATSLFGRWGAIARKRAPSKVRVYDFKNPSRISNSLETRMDARAVFTTLITCLRL